MSPCCLDEVPEQRGHAGEGERRDGQELPHAEVEVPAREVRVDERPEEVVVVVPRDAEDIQLINHAGVDEVLEEEWCGVAADTVRSGMGALRGAQRQGEWGGCPMW